MALLSNCVTQFVVRFHCIDAFQTSEPSIHLLKEVGREEKQTIVLNMQSFKYLSSDCLKLEMGIKLMHPLRADCQTNENVNSFILLQAHIFKN